MSQLTVPATKDSSSSILFCAQFCVCFEVTYSTPAGAKQRILKPKAKA